MTAPMSPRQLRRSYSYSARTASSTNVDRLQLFIAAWRQLPRSNPRRSTGKRLLQLVDPANDAAVEYREIQPRGVEEARLWEGAPSPASMALLQRELDSLNAGTSAADIRAALALGEPVSLTLDSFTPHGLGSFRNPTVPFYAIPTDERASRAVVHGSGCMSRNRATRARPAPPMLVHQFVGQTLWLYWPCTPGNLQRLDDASWSGMVTDLEQMHLVVLRPGECIFVPSMSSYITLSLGYDGTNIAAHLKYSLVPLQNGHGNEQRERAGAPSRQSAASSAASEMDVRVAPQGAAGGGGGAVPHQHPHHYAHQMPPAGAASPQPHPQYQYDDAFTQRQLQQPLEPPQQQRGRASFERKILSWWKRRDRSSGPAPSHMSASSDNFYHAR